MKRLFTNCRNIMLLLLCTGVFANVAHATVYTALLSGSFTSGLTWGGSAPSTLLSTDAIIIPSGITVTLPSAVTFTGTSSLQVNGTLNYTGTGTALIMTSGSLSGAGTINADSVVMGLTSGVTFTGNIVAHQFTSTGTSIGTSANVTVSDALHLAAGTMQMTSGSLTMGNNSTIYVEGGDISFTGTAAAYLDSAYNVMYTTSSATAGAELTGTGMNNVTVNVPSGTVTLSGNTTLRGMTTLTAGALVLNGHSLVFNNNADMSASGSGTITGSSSSDITVNATGGLAGALRFTSGSGSTLNNLTINTTSGSTSIGGNLAINNMLTLSSGALNLNGHTLTINSGGDIAASGSGAITGSSSSSIIINATSGLSGMLNFTSGSNMLNNLTLNSTSGGATLSDDLALSGTLTLTSGTLGLNGHTLTLNSGADLVSSGTGTINAGSGSSIVVNATGGLTGSLRFASGSGSTLNNLTVNTTSGSVRLSSDININGMLTLSSGALDLNGHMLTLNASGDLASGGSGSISGSSSSDIVINSTSGITGMLNFTSGSSLLNNLTINNAGGTSNLGSDLSLNGTLTLTAGNFGLNGHTFTLNGSADLASSGTGSLYGNSSSNLVINASGGLAGTLRFASAGSTLGNLTVNTGSGTVKLANNLSISNMLTLTSGAFQLNGHTLTFNSGGNLSTSGSGSITGSSTSNLVVNSTSGLTGNLRFTTGGNVLNNLTIGSSTGGATLGSDLNLDGTLTLNSGSMNLNGHTLTLNATANVAAVGSGTITGSNTSSIVINTGSSLSGTLSFTAGSNMLNNLTLNTGSSSATVGLGSDLHIHGMLSLQSGMVEVGVHNLMIDAGGMVMGGSANSYVVADNTGSLTMNLAAGSTDSFHVGTHTDYAPVTVMANTGSATGDVSVHTGAGVYANGTSGALLSTTDAMVNTTWYVSSSAMTSGINYTMTTMWNTSMEVNGFDRTHAFISHYGGTSWDMMPTAAAGTYGSLHTATRANITSLSPFMVTDNTFTTGINGITKTTAEISVYPNPVNEILHFTGLDNTDRVEVYDLNGKLVLSANGSNNTISVASLATGSYIVKLYSADASATARFVKQ